MTTAFGRTVLTAAFMISMSLSSVGVAQSTSGEKEQAQAGQNELQRRQDQEKLARVTRLKEWFLSQVQQTSDKLAKLAADNEPFTKQMTDLLTSDDGKRIAADPINLGLYVGFYERPIATAAEIKARQKAIASIADGVKAEMKELDVGYVPSPETVQEAVSLSTWTSERLGRLDEAKATIATAVEKAPKLDHPENMPTLAKAIEQLKAKRLQNLEDVKRQGEQAAEGQAKQIVMDAAHAAVLEQAAADAEKIKEENATKIAQLKASYELEVLQARRDAERRQLEAEKAYADSRAENARLLKDAATTRAVKDSEADIKRKQVVDEAKKKEQIALLNSDAVQQLLTPFFAKGYQQPGLRNGTYDPQPISLSQLGVIGALKPTPEGLLALMRVAAERDKDRPRWPYGFSVSKLTAEQREKVTQAQRLLIDLGDLMVEQHMLSK